MTKGRRKEEADNKFTTDKAILSAVSPNLDCHEGVTQPGRGSFPPFPAASSVGTTWHWPEGSDY